MKVAFQCHCKQYGLSQGFNGEGPILQKQLRIATFPERRALLNRIAQDTKKSL